MKNEFLLAIKALCAEKNLPEGKVYDALEQALVSAYKKNFNHATGVNQNITANIDPKTGDFRVFMEKVVVDDVADPLIEVTVDEARRFDENAEPGDVVSVDCTPADFGRIAAQTAKQVVLQRLREFEREAVFEEFSDKDRDIVSGTVQRIEPNRVIINLGKTEAVLPAEEQVPTERIRIGQRIKALVIDVRRGPKGPEIRVSRTHRDLLRRLFELEVPEIYQGTVEIKSIAREPGSRSKVAVSARQEGVDPVGACVGLRGIRIQNIVRELNDEKIDVVQWHPDETIFVANALSPAQVLSVELDDTQKTATVVVPDRQLSLAIGKEGQNARLAAKLTGWRIDIKASSVAKAERLEREARRQAEEAAAREAAIAAGEPLPEPETVPEEVPVVEAPQPVEIAPAAAIEVSEPEIVADEIAPAAEAPQPEEQPTLMSISELLDQMPEFDAPAPIRFAEEILGPGGGPERKTKKGKKGEDKEVAKAKKPAKRTRIFYEEEEDMDFDEYQEYVRQTRR